MNSFLSIPPVVTKSGRYNVRYRWVTSTGLMGFLNVVRQRGGMTAISSYYIVGQDHYGNF